VIYITTSWDDGHVLDFKVAELLKKYKLRGTFYVSKNHPQEKSNLSESKIITLAKEQEIGAHTINHLDLSKIPLAEAEQEIKESKKWLENILGKKVEIFCYPYGSYNKQVMQLVREAGFKGARTAKRFSIDKPANLYEMDTAINIYPFPFRKIDATHYYWGRLLQPYLENREGIKKLRLSFFSLKNWKSFSRAVFDMTAKKGVIFHLWGHSWEVEKYQMWKELENFFAYISGKNCLYLTNGEIIKKYENSDSV
jgi:peptidoglycan/xylan/chitin deacetylase (PgdA/CDA1 family)